MENETQQSPSQQPVEQKKERIDELDIVGGALVKFVINSFTRIKNLLSPKP